MTVLNDLLLNCIQQCKEKHKHLASEELIQKLADLEGKTIEQVRDKEGDLLRAGWLAIYCNRLCAGDENDDSGQVESSKEKSKTCDLKPRPFKY